MTGSANQVRQMIERDEARDIGSTLVILMKCPCINHTLLETEVTYWVQHSEHGLETESPEANQKALEVVLQALVQAKL